MPFTRKESDRMTISDVTGSLMFCVSVTLLSLHLLGLITLAKWWYALLPMGIAALVTVAIITGVLALSAVLAIVVYFGKKFTR